MGYVRGGVCIVKTYLRSCVENAEIIYVRSGVGIVSYFRSGIRKMRRKVKNRESIVKIYVKSRCCEQFCEKWSSYFVELFEVWNRYGKNLYVRKGVGMVKSEEWKVRKGKSFVRYGVGIVKSYVRS